MIKKLMLAAGFAATMVVASAAQAAPCAGFTDVPDTSPFCPNVEWLKNRGVTTGCTSSTLFCPTDPVSRLAMAAFMQRMGDALLPSSLITTDYNELGDDIDVPAPTVHGLNVGNGVLMCVTPDLAPANFPRRVIAEINTNGSSQNPTLTIRQRLAVSIDGGTSWNVMDPLYYNKASTVAGEYYTLTSPYLYDIPATETTRFAIFLDRYKGAATAGDDTLDTDCSIRRIASSRTGAASPLDASTKRSRSRN